MKGLKIGQGILSLIHLIGQIFIYITWSNGYEALTRSVPLEKGQVTAAILMDMVTKVGRHSFKFLFFGVLALAFYLTISNHITAWITEAKIDSKS